MNKAYGDYLEAMLGRYAEAGNDPEPARGFIDFLRATPGDGGVREPNWYDLARAEGVHVANQQYVSSLCDFGVDADRIPDDDREQLVEDWMVRVSELVSATDIQYDALTDVLHDHGYTRYQVVPDHHFDFGLDAADGFDESPARAGGR